jgi:hypothetical protein
VMPYAEVTRLAAGSEDGANAPAPHAGHAPQSQD